MSKEDKARIIENINATMKIENQTLTLDDKKMLEHFADNKITLEEAIKMIKESILKRV